MAENQSLEDDKMMTSNSPMAGNISSTMNVTSGPIFDAANERMMNVNIYPLIFVMVYAVLGLIGNSIVIYVYWTKWKRNKTRIFILCLGFLDLANCAFNMPVEVAVLWNPLTFDYHYLCKISRGATFVINNAGSLVFLSIAIERYMLVYHPLRYRRMTPKFAKIMCTLAFLIGSSVSWPSFIFYGRFTFSIPISKNMSAQGETCHISDEYVNEKHLTLIYTTILFCLMILIFILLTALYIAIGRKIYLATCTDIVTNDKDSGATKMFGKSILSALTGGGRNDTLQYKRQSTYSATNVDFQSNFETSELSPPYCAFPAENEKLRLSLASVTDDRRLSTFRTIDSRQQNRMSRKFSTLKAKPTRKNTVMMRVVTIAFMLSFTPFLCILIIRYTNPKYYDSLDTAGQIAYSIFIRSYFINSMVNPFIYGFMNMRFREHVKSLFLNVFCFFRKRKPVG